MAQTCAWSSTIQAGFDGQIPGGGVDQGFRETQGIESRTLLRLRAKGNIV